MPFILRVDDVGWKPEDKSPDRGLEYFRVWRETLGLKGKPVYYGTIPQSVDDRDLQILSSLLEGDEEVAVHGWDHKPKAEVTPGQMHHSVNRFSSAGLHSRCRSYIPPFNEYTNQTIGDWFKVRPKSYFFGGFPNLGDRNSCNLLPWAFPHGGCFLGAVRELYDHSDVLLQNIPEWTGLDCPLVVTMHATWGYQNLELVHKVGEMLSSELVSLGTVNQWLFSSTRLNRENLTAPHYLAYSWVVGKLREHVNKDVLDFGCRYSKLPHFLSLRGCRVSVTDRDPFSEFQTTISRSMGTKNVSLLNYNRFLEENDRKFDAIVCCWVLQHNLPAQEKIPPTVKMLSSRLNPGGKLLVVGSFSPDKSFEQLNREDPQMVLNSDGYLDYIIAPSGLVVGEQSCFRYEHGSPNGAFCDLPKANAICLELVKPN